ncbi:MAG: hypothetical protein WC400_00860 [Patescibacteria group bacterium]|jgi:heme/copper-type cytochrome/quinol oxidase subunit 2
MEVVIIWIIYFVLLLLSLIYAGVIIYHILKYRYDDLPREQGQYAGRALALYLGLGGLTLLLSIVIALFMILF